MPPIRSFQYVIENIQGNIKVSVVAVTDVYMQTSVKSRNQVFKL